MSIQVQPRPMTTDIIISIIKDAYQAECERFDPEIERTDGDVIACRHDLWRAVGTSRMQALVDRLIEAEEVSAEVRNRGFFTAGIAAGIRIAVLVGVGEVQQGLGPEVDIQNE